MSGSPAEEAKKKSTHGLQLIKVPRARLYIAILQAFCELYNTHTQVPTMSSLPYIPHSPNIRHSPLTCNSHEGTCVCCCCCAGAACCSAGALSEPPKSMCERPWPIVEPTATDPAVAAICASMPGCLGWAWPWACAAAAGGEGACAGA